MATRICLRSAGNRFGEWIKQGQIFRKSRGSPAEAIGTAPLNLVSDVAFPFGVGNAESLYFIIEHSS
jgi:hypothetical protein